MDAFRFVPLGFVAAGLLFAVIGIHTYRSSRRFERNAQRASATITKLTQKSIGRRPGVSGLIWVPTVRFQAADGRTIEVEAAAGTNPSSHQEGQQVDVLYDPRTPEHVRLATGGAGAIFSYGFILFGAVLAFLGLIVFVLLSALG